MGRTLYDKLWDEHVVHTEDDGTALLYIDENGYQVEFHKPCNLDDEGSHAN